MKPNDDAVDYVANLINQEESARQGYGGSARWWCLDASLKEKYREAARTRIQKWADAEREVRAKADAELAGPLPRSR